MKTRGQVLAEIAAGAPALVISGEDFLVYLGEDAGIFLLRQQFGLSADQLQARIDDVSVALEIELLNVPPPLPRGAGASRFQRPALARRPDGPVMRRKFNKSTEDRIARIRRIRLLAMKRTMACSLADYLGLYPTPLTVVAVTERVARKARKTPAELKEHGVEVRILFERFLTDGAWFSAEIAMVVVTEKVSAA